MKARRITAAFAALAVSAGMFTALPITASADDAFAGTVTMPGYIESEGDTYDYMYEYTVGGDTADKWYYDQSPSITLDNRYGRRCGINGARRQVCEAYIERRPCLQHLSRTGKGCAL
ncbi:MAG: hypothetical protein ACI4DP_06930 [Candidatus Ornithomonoglobus sp.]